MNPEIRIRARLVASVMAALVIVSIAVPAVPQEDAQRNQQRSVLTLGECLAIALDGSAFMAVSAENAEVARAAKRQAWGAFLPDLSFSRTYNKSERTDFDVQQTGVASYSIATDNGDDSITLMQQVLLDEYMDSKTKSTYQDYALRSNWNVFSGFSKFSGLKSAGNDLAAAEQDQAYSRQLVIQNVVVAYMTLIRNERLLEVAVDSEDLAARELEKSETYHRIGSAAKSEVLQAKVRLEQTRLDVINARNAAEQSFAELAHAMNRPLAERFDVDRSLLDTDFAVGELGALFDEAMLNRADLLSREHQVEARAGDVTSATANLWPRLDLFVNYTRYENESPFRFGAQKSDNLAYGYQLNWNVFDRYQTLAGRSQAKARERIAEYNLDQARLDVQLEVRQIYNLMMEARERVSLTRETIISAEEELRLAQERFRVGAGTMLDRITAQVNLASARADEVRAVSDFLVASLQLDRAVGRPLDRLLEGEE